MFRIGINLLVVAVLTACPLFCFVGNAYSTDAQLVVERTCRCCLPPATPAEPVQQEPCVCGNCICHGAVFETQPDLVDATNTYVFDAGLVSNWLSDQAPLEALQNPLFPDGTCGFSHPSGRFARLAHQSWLL